MNPLFHSTTELTTTSPSTIQRYHGAGAQPTEESSTIEYVSPQGVGGRLRVSGPLTFLLVCSVCIGVGYAWGQMSAHG